MSSTTKCIIQFHDNPLNIYYAGQIVHGSVLLTLKKAKIVRGIYAEIVGKASCEWSTGSGKSKQVHKGEELYFCERIYLVGGERGERTVEPGAYTYTFECQLPNANLPTSFEASIGYVRYSVRVNLDRPLWPDQEFEVAFTVLKPLDLTDLLMLRTPIQLSNENYFNLLCCWCYCFKSKPLLIEGKLPITGYVPGQTIYVDVKISNLSFEDIDRFYIKMIKVITYFQCKDSHISTQEEIVVAERMLDGCARDEVKLYNQQIKVPSVPPTDTSTSNICKIEYVLRIIGDAQIFCQNDPYLNMPITIGTQMSYTLTSLGWHHQQRNSLSPNYGSIGGAGIQHQRQIGDGGSYSQNLPNTDLPTYDEAVGRTFANLKGGNTYKPNYIIYNN